MKNATLWDVYVYKRTYDYYNNKRIG